MITASDLFSHPADIVRVMSWRPLRQGGRRRWRGGWYWFGPFSECEAERFTYRFQLSRKLYNIWWWSDVVETEPVLAGTEATRVRPLRRTSSIQQQRTTTKAQLKIN